MNDEKFQRADADLMCGEEAAGPSPEERAQWAERRHLFWRSRCLEHARTIDRQEKHLHHLRDVIATLEKRLDKRDRALNEIHSWLVCGGIASSEDMAQSFEHMCNVASNAIDAH